MVWSMKQVNGDPLAGVRRGILRGKLVNSSLITPSLIYKHFLLHHMSIKSMPYIDI